MNWAQTPRRLLWIYGLIWCILPLLLAFIGIAIGADFATALTFLISLPLIYGVGPVLIAIFGASLLITFSRTHNPRNQQAFQAGIPIAQSTSEQDRRW